MTFSLFLALVLMSFVCCLNVIRRSSDSKDFRRVVDGKGSVVKCNVWMGIVFKRVGGNESEGRFVCGDLHSICF